MLPQHARVPTLRRYITNNDKLEHVDRAMQLYSRIIPSFSHGTYHVPYTT
jgi:hypothetical protein